MLGEDSALSSYRGVIDRQTLTTNRLTIRLPTSILEYLKNEAERRDIPINALVIRLLTKNIACERFVEMVPTITMPHSQFVTIFNEASEAAINALTKDGPLSVQKGFMIAGSRYGLTEIIPNYFAILGKYCGWYKFSYQTEDHRYRLVFESQLGQKWSKFLASYIRNILESLNVYEETDTINDNIIVFGFTKK